MKKMTYKDSGVNIEAGYESVERMKKHVEKTKTKGVLEGLGGFGGMFELPEGYKKPVLVSGTDGVGTKLMIAQMMDRHDTIGMDCVAMCVNDIVCQGAKPLYFLDYIACGKNQPEVIEQIVKGICDGCLESDMALIGGETAEMPDMYDKEEYDLAGFAVGIAEKAELIDRKQIANGDCIIGLPSSGIHSNGYSLVRKIVLDYKKRSLTDHVDQLGETLGEALLRPTKIYVKPVLKALEFGGVKGLAHITGGGFYENIPRMLPGGLKAVIEEGSFVSQPIFQFLQEEGDLEQKEMYSTFNMGIGLMMVVEEEEANDLIRVLRECGEEAKQIGRVEKGEGVELV